MLQATETNDNIHGVKASTTTTFDISIQDINDNKPDFYKCAETCVVTSQFTGEVLEHSLGSISFDMTVRDPDRVGNQCQTSLFYKKKTNELRRCFFSIQACSHPL